jgi:hypothetical protein
MPRGRRRIEGPLTPLANNRRQFEKKQGDIVRLVHRELDRITSIPTTAKPVHAGSRLRVDLQKEPYPRGGRYWASLAVQGDDNVYGQLEVECDQNFGVGQIAEAMIETCANASESEFRGNDWVVTAYFQYVLWVTAQPSGVVPA